MKSTELAKNYLALAAAVLGVLGLLLIFVPTGLMHLLSIPVSPTGTLFMQYLGASLAGHAFLNWRARHFEAQVLKIVYEMNIVALALAVCISLVAIFATVYSHICLLIFIMHGAFLSGFLVIFKGMPNDVKSEKNLR